MKSGVLSYGYSLLHPKDVKIICHLKNAWGKFCSGPEAANHKGIQSKPVTATRGFAEGADRMGPAAW